jgi:hypothetical protein
MIFDQVTSKSIGVIYSVVCTKVPSLKILKTLRAVVDLEVDKGARTTPTPIFSTKIIKMTLVKLSIWFQK